MACQTSAMQSYFVPELGPAPNWSSFLENVTEEMTELAADQITYDDYKFVTAEELRSLCLDHLVAGDASTGKLVRPYMHGFFINHKLYQKAKAIVNPFAYQEYREKVKQEKLDELRQSRLTSSNSAAAAGAKKNKNNTAVLDDRFKMDLQDNPDFAIDSESEEYKLLHPHLADKKIINSQKKKHDSDSDSDSDDDEKHFNHHHQGKKEVNDDDSDESDGDSSDGDDLLAGSNSGKLTSKRNREIQKKKRENRDYRKSAAQLYAGKKTASQARAKTNKSFADRLKESVGTSKNNRTGGHQGRRFKNGSVNVTFSTSKRR